MEKQKIDFNKMCDHCFHMMADDEVMFGFKIIDDFDKERVLKGHQDCMDEVAKKIQDIYGGN